MNFSEAVNKRPADGTTEMGQPLLPLDQESEYPAGYPPPPGYPNTSVYPGQQYGAPVGPYPGSYPGSYPGIQVVTVQPTVVTNTLLFNPLPDYMCYSIFTMLCCCLPLGVAALVYSITTKDANAFGHRQIAEKNSRMARTLNHISLGIGLAFILLLVIFFIAFGIIVSQLPNF